MGCCCSSKTDSEHNHGIFDSSSQQHETFQAIPLHPPTIDTHRNSSNVSNLEDKSSTSLVVSSTEELSSESGKGNGGGGPRHAYMLSMVHHKEANTNCVRNAQTIDDSESIVESQPQQVITGNLFYVHEEIHDTAETSTLHDHPRDTSSGAESTHELVRGVDADGNKLLNEYVVVAPIGEGSFGKVKLCADTLKGTSVAIKILDKLRLEKKARRIGADVLTPFQHIHQEVDIMKACRHPNLVKLMNVIKDPNATKLYLVMEYMEGGPLGKTPSITATLQNPASSMPASIDVGRIRSNVLDVLHGLQFLHGKGVIHMDIKPENILIGKDGECKLADFGVCTVLGEGFEINTRRDDMVYHIQGTPPYFAPEMLSMAMEANTGGGFHGKATDVWALGVTLYSMVYGQLPFQGASLVEYYENVIHTEPLFPPRLQDMEVPVMLIDVMRWMLDKNPSRRPRVRDLVSHPFFLVNSIERVPLYWWVKLRR
eukprot:PhF_6_TR6179/c0_g1_i1/m.9264/K07359/CAMKK2; calcium/calmodulin-dependent protein kinase kinase 2